MKSKKYTILALLLALLMMLTVAFAACSKDGDTDGDGDGTNTEQPGGETGGETGGENEGGQTEIEEPITAKVDYTVTEVPAISYDSSGKGYADESIKTGTFTVTYAASETLTLYTEKGGVVDVTDGKTYTIGNVKTDTYTVTAKAAGEYVLRLKKGDDLAAKLVYTVSEAYPTQPDFNALAGYGSSSTAEAMAIAYSHDPVVVEADGKFYSFSTDNTGSFGYQVRRSDDMIKWEYVGNAIENCGTATTAQDVYEGGNGGLQKVYEIISRDYDWSYWGGGDNEGANWTLWAPDVVKGADGKYWLYGCWTADFGSAHSVIFLCKADSVEGPYEYVDILLYSYDGGDANPNAIDPSVYSAPDGKMYMAYGSFAGGIWSIELDPATGLRKDGLKDADLLSGSSKSVAERYGQCLVYNSSTEGPVVAYHSNVAIYEGDPVAYTDDAASTRNQYVMMSSSNSLSSDYNMRSYTSTEPYADTFRGRNSNTAGNRVSGSFSWRLNEEDGSVSYDFAYPGHNDMITTSTGKNLLAFHNRVSFASGSANHYLLTSLYGFNARGELVMNPNRYAGETERVVTGQELTEYSNGKYSFAYVLDSLYSSSYNGGYAMQGLYFEPSETDPNTGVLKFGDGEVGTWTLYGDNWVYVNITTPIEAVNNNQTLSGAFYGMAFPAYIEAEGKGGISLSFLSEDGQRTLYMNMDFSA